MTRRFTAELPVWRASKTGTVAYSCHSISLLSALGGAPRATLGRWDVADSRRHELESEPMSPQTFDESAPRPQPSAGFLSGASARVDLAARRAQGQATGILPGGVLPISEQASLVASEQVEEEQVDKTSTGSSCQAEASTSAATGASVDEATAAECGGSIHRHGPFDEGHLQAWIALVVRQDQLALAKLYDAMAGRVYGLALRITRQVQTAEEVTEDVFWQVWRNAPRFDAARGGAMAWILTMARSRALDALRRTDRAVALNEQHFAALPGDADPQDLLAAVQREHRLHVALRNLDPLPRQLLALAFFRGFSHEEIASQMSLPLGTVKSHIRRALLRMRPLLAADDGPSSVVTP